MNSPNPDESAPAMSSHLSNHRNDTREQKETDMTTTHTLKMPGANLYYEVRGEGPVLVALGSPMDSGPFAPLAELMARDYTVVTHDPRGITNSTIDDPDQDSTPELRADDVAAILDHLGSETADLLGSSGGAVTGLAMAERHPGRLRTLIAHEPPLLTLLPDADERLAATEENIATFHNEGIGAAWMQFMANAGFIPDSNEDEPTMPDFQPTEQDMKNSARFFGHELRGTAQHRPDTEALKNGPVRIIVGIGDESEALLTYRTSTALAERLDIAPTSFPGGHGGFAEQPEAFAKALQSVLAEG